MSRRLLIRITGTLGLALGAAALMGMLDSGGTAWLKFLLYAVMFVSIYSGMLLSPIKSCGVPLFRRQPKR
jgi:hypothetical protein